MVSKLKNMSQKNFIRMAILIHLPISILYWAMIKAIIKIWGKRGLHVISVGEYTGGTEKKRSEYREDMLLKTFSLFVYLKGRSCLDLACNDGFWSFRLGRYGIKEMLGIDLAAENVNRADFLKSIYAFPSYRFEQCDIFSFVNNNTKPYDIVLLLSILYHLPEQNDWSSFFKAIGEKNTETLIIDTRWFDNDEYWYDKSSYKQALLNDPRGNIRKWRLTRREVIDYIYDSGYEQIVEINPSVFLEDTEDACGDGDPYSLENVADYITDNRSIIIAYKNKTMMPDIQNYSSLKYH